jgi:Protein of unknown function (DUF1573)
MIVQNRETRVKYRFRGELLALSIVVLLVGGCAGGKPDIAVTAKRHDFGRIKQGAVVTAEIAVRNSGNKELKIESVATSCGCTSAQVKPKIIPSGGEGKLFIRYDSGVHPDKGPIERHVYIASNDPQKAEVEVIVTAEVQPPA